MSKGFFSIFRLSNKLYQSNNNTNNKQLFQSHLKYCKNWIKMILYGQSIYKLLIKMMSNPYSHPFLKRQNTMYLSTITKQDFPSQPPPPRESSFLRNDIEGAKPKLLIPKLTKQISYSLSTYIEPPPNHSRSISKRSNPLYIDDIEGCRTKVKQFRTKRVVNPLNPQYNLPSVSIIQADQGRPFFRNTLDIKDINHKRVCKTETRKQRAQEPIDGSGPAKLNKQIKAISRLEVKDINKLECFQSKRVANPLAPSYFWRDNDDKKLNQAYGWIEGNNSRINHPEKYKKPGNLCLSIKDIQGTQANSFFTRTHFIDKRRQFRNYMQLQDIQKSCASSLKKGISTIRQTNPLTPQYQFPGAQSPAN